MEAPTSSWGSRNRLTCLTLQEHDDDDDDDDKKYVTNRNFLVLQQAVHLFTIGV